VIPYLDTSFLVSLYTLDANSPAAARHMRTLSAQIPLTPLHELELANAFELRVFRREIRKSQAEAARAALIADLAGGMYASGPVPAAAYTRARQLALRHTANLGTRAIDLLHVASALVLHAEQFYSFDQRQCKAAEAAGITVAVLK
jgi:predicted nucleic acid-binding protein